MHCLTVFHYYYHHYYCCLLGVFTAKTSMIHTDVIQVDILSNCCIVLLSLLMKCRCVIRGLVSSKDTLTFVQGSDISVVCMTLRLRHVI